MLLPSLLTVVDGSGAAKLPVKRLTTAGGDGEILCTRSIHLLITPGSIGYLINSQDSVLAQPRVRLKWFYFVDGFIV